jgi:hypothetical protein
MPYIINPPMNVLSFGGNLYIMGGDGFGSTDFIDITQTGDSWSS